MNGARKDAAHAIAVMVRDFSVEDRRSILQLLDLVVGELNVTAHLQALVSAADLLADFNGLTRVAVLAEVLHQFGVAEASFSCAECGAVFTGIALCNRCGEYAPKTVLVEPTTPGGAS